MGILEQILEEVRMLRQQLTSGAAIPGTGGAAAMAAHVGASALGLAAQPAQVLSAVPANLTADEITKLIQPHLGNDAIKTDLGAAMRAMGIGGLPETRPDQYADLYRSFQTVLARHGIGGAGQAAAPVAAASII